MSPPVGGCNRRVMQSNTALLIGVGLLVLGAVAGASSTGLIFTDVVLEDGATDGDSGYYKLGNGLILIAKPGSYEESLLEPLKGRRVEFRLVGR